MASSGDWDAEQMLVKYIYDYILRKNLHTAAEMFAGDANVGKTPVGGFFHPVPSICQVF